jgi:putative membrane protein
MEVCGACERIRKTPISSSYIWFCRQSIGVYLLILPIAMAQDQGWATVPAVMFVGYFMIGLETMAEVIEQPFGFDEDDLDLDCICETIRRSAEQILNKSST